MYGNGHQQYQHKKNKIMSKHLMIKTHTTSAGDFKYYKGKFTCHKINEHV